MGQKFETSETKFSLVSVALLHLVLQKIVVMHLTACEPRVIFVQHICEKQMHHGKAFSPPWKTTYFVTNEQGRFESEEEAIEPVAIATERLSWMSTPSPLDHHEMLLMMNIHSFTFLQHKSTQAEQTNLSLTPDLVSFFV